MDRFDVAIIGGGAVGSAVAYVLGAYDLRVAVIEKELDVAMGASGRNSAVVHAGFNNRPGSLMAQLCVEGNRGFAALCRALDVPYRRTGKLVVGSGAEDARALEGLLRTGLANGCTGLSLLDGAAVSAREPHVRATAAMLSADTAIIDPFLYNIHLAECAVKNGVRYLLGREVTAIERRGGTFRITAGGETVEAGLIVNSAGLYADRVSAMAGDASFTIYPCRGEYYLLDKAAGQRLSMPVYPVPRPGVGGLGVHLTPTIDGNVLIGPSAEYVDGREETATTAPMLERLWQEAAQLHDGLDRRDIIGAYAGLRAKLVARGQENYGDFIIEESPRVEGLIQLVGIESPGLTASLPIARRVEAMVVRRLRPARRAGYDPTYRRIPSFAESDEAGRAALIAADPDYGEIVCRCESVTRAEVLRALNNPLGAHALVSVKNRTRATMGRCNGGYCFTRLIDLFEQELGLAPERIALKREGDRPIAGALREVPPCKK